jgi:hypothetical protein
MLRRRKKRMIVVTWWPMRRTAASNGLCQVSMPRWSTAWHPHRYEHWMGSKDRIRCLLRARWSSASLKNIRREEAPSIHDVILLPEKHFDKLSLNSKSQEGLCGSSETSLATYTSWSLTQMPPTIAPRLAAFLHLSQVGLKRVSSVNSL